jgi:two-component system cell cycle sensor histidine kinase/response regulator CckA
LGRVKADPGQIEQVIMNLAVNARDAMPRGGKLTIETADVELGEDYARNLATFQPGPYVMLAVSDTGIGMDEKTPARIFEPFFTTKELGKGTGLGLATVYGIVKPSGGYIWVYSEPGRGSTFKIHLPRVDAPVASPCPGLELPAALSRGTETILWVEDEPAVRALVQEMLQSRGYTLLVARHGEEALRLAEEHQGRINLLLTDVVMPGMTGPDLFQRLEQTHPAMKVLFVSGYASTARLHHDVLSPQYPFLQKPFTPQSLAHKIREVLAQ